MKLASKPDWAKLKLMREYCIEDGEDGYRACLVPLATVAKLLRAERRRAMRKCRNMVVKASRDPKEKLIYFEACDDCATAIAGGK